MVERYCSLANSACWRDENDAGFSFLAPFLAFTLTCRLFTLRLTRRYNRCKYSPLFLIFLDLSISFIFPSSFFLLLLFFYIIILCVLSIPTTHLVHMSLTSPASLPKPRPHLVGPRSCLYRLVSFSSALRLSSSPPLVFSMGSAIVPVLGMNDASSAGGAFGPSTGRAAVGACRNQTSSALHGIQVFNITYMRDCTCFIGQLLELAATYAYLSPLCRHAGLE